MPQLSLGLPLGALFLMVDAAELIGLHGSLGSLLFGASLSGLPYPVRREIMPGLRSTAEGLFVPLFFASAGLHFPCSFIAPPPWTMTALTLIPLAGNFLGAFVGAYVSRLTVTYAAASGLMGKGVAEIALLLVLRESGTIDKVVFSFLALVMFGYILLMPAAISFAVSRASRRIDPDTRLDDIPQGVARFALNEVTVNNILDRSRRHPDTSLSVRDFTERWTVPYQHDCVVPERGALPGVVSLGLLRYLPQGVWGNTTLVEVMRSQIPVARPEEHIEDVFQRMTENYLTAMPVVERGSGRFLGRVTSQGIVEVVLNKGRH